MSASRYIKDRGFKSLQAVADKIGITRYRLARWYKYEPYVFEAIIDGLRYQDMIKRELDR
jgi:hypothetical protein